jgi:hypothetical protein
MQIVKLTRPGKKTHRATRCSTVCSTAPILVTFLKDAGRRISKRPKREPKRKLKVKKSFDMCKKHNPTVLIASSKSRQPSGFICTVFPVQHRTHSTIQCSRRCKVFGSFITNTKPCRPIFYPILFRINWNY